MVQFEPYQGAKCSGARSSPQTWGLGEITVLKLLDVLPKEYSYHVFIDNFFTSVRLMRFLKNNNIKASGTLRENRIHKNCTIARKKVMSKGKRGFAQQQTSKDNTATIVAWKDNKVVFSRLIARESLQKSKWKGIVVTKESHGESTILYQFIQ